MTSPPSEPAMRLLIVDDQSLIRRGLAMMLATEPGIEVIGQAADGQEAIELACLHRPDVVVMDLQMPRVSGVVATREITAALPSTRVVVLTTYDDDERVFEAIRAGAQAYLLKDASEAEILDTIRAVQRGESRLSPSIARKVLEQFRLYSARVDVARDGTSTPSTAALDGPSSGPGLRAPPSASPDPTGLGSLTDKETRVLNLLAQGLTNKQIAATVFLAEGTVKNYVSRIMDKLHAGNRMELALRAMSIRRG